MKRKKSRKPELPAVEKPLRPADHHSKRGVPYWWAPEWVRESNGSMGRVRAIKEKNGEVNLYMESKTCNLTYIQGSIQQEFKQWHEDRQIDYILLGVDPDELLQPERDANEPV